MKKKILVILIILSMVIVTNFVNALTNKGYYDQDTTSDNNNSFATAELISSERVLRGQLLSSTDTNDYYKFYISAGASCYVQLSGISSGSDYDLFIYNPSQATVASSRNSPGIGEWVSFTASTSGYYYIRVQLLSGTGSSASYYRLYPQVSGQHFNQSFYITKVTDDAYMYNLGCNQTNNLAGLVFLDFGIPQKESGVYGVYDLGGFKASLSRVKLAVDKYIEGYNANPKHTANITVVVSVNNKRIGSNPLAATTTEHSNHGVAFKNMVNSISTSGLVANVVAGIDAEMDYNTATLTRAWVDGFSGAGDYEPLYNFGDHAGRTDDFSSETDPTFNNGWKASDIHYISWGNSCSYCVPQIYVEGMAKQWTYQKKWSYIYYSGVMSTNTWATSLYSNQESYNTFNSWLSNNGVGQTLSTKTWISLPSPAQLDY
jgi:hypothetical protein